LKKRLMFGIALIAGMVVAACESTGPGEPWHLALTARKSTLTVGDTATVWVQAMDSDYNPIANADLELEFESSDEDVATIDASGKVTAVGAGAATIRGTAGAASNTIGINVVPQPAG
jgi:hypothetical protein